MSYTPGYTENESPQLHDSWNSNALYAPTPGNVSQTSTPRLRSPSRHTYVERTCSPHEPQSVQLCFVPFALWDKETIYDEQPPIYVHYLIDWKVTLNNSNRAVTRVTEPDLVLAPSVYWQKVLKKKIEDVKGRRAFTNRRVRLDYTTIMASVLNDRSPKLHQEFEGIDIDWTNIERQILSWSELFRKGKRLKLDVCVNYLADDNESASSRNGEKRNTRSVTNAMLTERDAQIDAEQVSGHHSPWRDVYNKMRCSGPPCKNAEGYCWQDPHGKKHYRLKTHHLKRLVDMVQKKRLHLETHDDVPEDVRRQLRAEHEQSLGRQNTNRNSSTDSPCPPIHINFLPGQSPQVSTMATPAATPPLLPYSSSGPRDPIVIPDLPLDVAVEEYATWQKSRVASQEMKAHIDNACKMALANGFDLMQIDKDQNPSFFTERGVMEGVARRFVEDIREWSNNYESLF